MQSVFPFPHFNSPNSPNSLCVKSELTQLTHPKSLLLYHLMSK